MKIYLPLLILSASLLSSCSSVMDSAQPVRQAYMLMPLPASSAAVAERGPVLSINLGAVPGLDTDRIQALGTNAELRPYANARWPDHLPEVLTSVIQRSLMGSGQFSTVEQSSMAGGDDWMLNLEVTKFYGLQNAEGNTTSVATEISGSIDCLDRSGVFTLSQSVPVSMERLSSVVAAHQQGLDDVTRQLIKRVTESCS